MKIDLEYLKVLLKEVNEKIEKAVYVINDPNCSLSYMANKKNTEYGLFSGLNAMYYRQKYQMKEHEKLRKGSKNYFKYYRCNEQLHRVETIHDNKIDVIFVVRYEKDYCYFFPFSSNGHHYPTYTYVTNFEQDHVVEEYMVGGVQIVYQKYEYLPNDQVGYYCINYVPNGSYPILGQCQGIYKQEDTISYTPLDSYAWYDEYKKNKQNKG